jgi:hypothetical protein
MSPRSESGCNRPDRRKNTFATHRNALTLILLAIALLLLGWQKHAAADIAWSPDERVSDYPADSRFASAASDFAGNVHVVWHDYRDGGSFAPEIYYARWDGVSWTANVRLTYNTGRSWHADVVSDPSNRIHVAWSDTPDGPEEIYYTFWNGISWAPIQRLTYGGALAQGPSLAADPSGNIHVAWNDTRDGSPFVAEIYYKRWNGSSWTADQRLTNDPALSLGPSLASDPNGNIHLVWYDERDGNREIYYKRWNGTSWTADQRLTNSAGISEHPSLTSDPEGVIHVVWEDRRDGNAEIYYKRLENGIWTADERLTNDAAGSIDPSIVSEGTGNLDVVWTDGRDGNHEIYYKRWDGVSWTADRRLTEAAGDSWSPCVVSDLAGGLHVVWEDTRDGNSEIYHKRGIEGPSDLGDEGVESRPWILRVGPNPMMDLSFLDFMWPPDTVVGSRIYDCSGRLVRNLGERVTTRDVSRIGWNGRDDMNLRVGAGVYYWTIGSKAQQEVTRVVLCR